MRFIFRRYAELGSARLLKEELDARGITSKSWTSASGRRIGGKPSDPRASLYIPNRAAPCHARRLASSLARSRTGDFRPAQPHTNPTFAAWGIGEGGRWAMRTIRLLISGALMSAAFAPWALAQNGAGTGAAAPGPPSVGNSGNYGAGSYGTGFTGPGLTGPGSYGPGSYGPGSGASPTPTTPFTYFQGGGGAAGTVSVPSAPSRR